MTIHIYAWRYPTVAANTRRSPCQNFALDAISPMQAGDCGTIIIAKFIVQFCSEILPVRTLSTTTALETCELVAAERRNLHLKNISNLVTFFYK